MESNEVYALWYEHAGFYKHGGDVLGIFTDKDLLKRTVDTHIQSLINQIDTEYCSYELETNECDKWKLTVYNKRVFYFDHVYEFTIRPYETNTIKFEEIEFFCY